MGISFCANGSSPLHEEVFGLLKEKILMAEHTHYRGLYRVGAQNLADEFVGMGHEVLYLSGPLNLYQLRHIPLFRNEHSREARKVFFDYIIGGVKYDSNLTSYPVLTLLPISRKAPFGTSKTALYKSLNFAVPSVFKYIKSRQFNNPDLLLVSQLAFAQLLEKVEAKTKVLRLTDDISEFDEVPKEIRLVEQWAVSLADYVVVTSRPLEKRLKSMYGAKVLYCPNGVNLKKMYSVPVTYPTEYRSFQGPIVVYVGAIDHWFDIELVKFLATQNKGFHFVIIGSPRVNLESVLDVDNIHILGYRPYTNIPNYLRHADVGIIPFKRCKLVESVSPIKLYEYCAFGLSVVSTNWEEIKLLNSPAFLADDYLDFNRLLRQAVSLRRTDFSKKCIEFSKFNTWETRARMIIDICKK